MAITDLKARQGKVDIVVEVTAKDEPREFEKFGKKGKVCSATVKDDSGEIKLSLWNEQADTVNVGDRVHIINGYVNEFQGELQLTAGKFGKLEIVEKGSEVVTEDEKTEEEDKDELNKPKPASEEEMTTDEYEEAVEEEVLDK
ncbi:MAG: OB-fold nucleic acid binding domain-containing protein [Nanoarchaeota archaeon]|nr:OB-fold nucleic acid binding domain-containing protein [Nanoarchaeota archaeon]